jgi:hypothetical protein
MFPLGLIASLSPEIVEPVRRQRREERRAGDDRSILRRASSSSNPICQVVVAIVMLVVIIFASRVPSFNAFTQLRLVPAGKVSFGSGDWAAMSPIGFAQRISRTRNHFRKL